MASGDVVLITGASSGVGKLAAQLLASEGYRVFGTSRRPQPSSDGVTMLVLDVQKPDTIRACVDEVLAQAGKIDVLINNAGIVGVAGAIEEVDVAQIRDIFETNFFGAIMLTQAVLPHMRERQSGRILNISSAAGFTVAPPYFTAYCASKHALEAFTEGLRYETRLFNVKVSLLQFGFMRTNIEASIAQPSYPHETYAFTRQRAYEADLESLKRGRDPMIVAQAIARILRIDRPRLRYRVGVEVWMLNVLKRFTPFEVSEAIVGRVFFGKEAWSRDKLGWRAIMLDTKVIDSVSRIMSVVGALALVLLAVFLLSRLS
jgi:NAD(P)-dependent dehydrogenase (short-subunit alcohol dehydrogenase family)